MDQPDHLRRQLAHVRRYLQLLFQVSAAPAARSVRAVS
jgi:hypothetical protein